MSTHGKRSLVSAISRAMWSRLSPGPPGDLTAGDRELAHVSPPRATLSSNRRPAPRRRAPRYEVARRRGQPRALRDQLVRLRHRAVPAELVVVAPDVEHRAVRHHHHRDAAVAAHARHHEVARVDRELGVGHALAPEPVAVVPGVRHAHVRRVCDRQAEIVAAEHRLAHARRVEHRPAVDRAVAAVEKARELGDVVGGEEADPNRRTAGRSRLLSVRRVVSAPRLQVERAVDVVGNQLEQVASGQVLHRLGGEEGVIGMVRPRCCPGAALRGKASDAKRILSAYDSASRNRRSAGESSSRM